jgi:uncharacterized protein YdaU (DUF1376 family)
MSALPYIKVYPGDELKECGHLPLDVYGGYMKLRYKMWDAPERGKIAWDMAAFRRTMGADSLQDAERIVNALITDKIFVRENNMLVLRAMVAAEQLSLVRKESGSKGGSKTRAKREQNKNVATDFAIANSVAKQQQNREYEYEYETEHENVSDKGKGGTGENLTEPTNGKITANSNLILDECLHYYTTTRICYGVMEVLMQRKPELLQTDAAGKITGIDTERIQRWGKVFNTLQKQKSIESRPLGQWAEHFNNWICKEDISKQPEKYFDNGADRTHRNGDGQLNGHAARSGNAPAGLVIPDGNKQFGKL